MFGLHTVVAVGAAYGFLTCCLLSMPWAGLVRCGLLLRNGILVTPALYVWMTGASLALLLLEHSAMNTAWQRFSNATDGTGRLMYQDDKHRAERNWWIAATCFAVWVLVWRLGSVLQGAVAPRPAAGKAKGPSKGNKVQLIFWGVCTVVLLVCLDVVVARVDYVWQVRSSVAPLQTEGMDYLKANPSCSSAMRGDGKCAALCDTVFKAASERQAVLMNVRYSHPAGGVAAFVFDLIRGQSQGSKIEDLFTGKTCARVNESVMRGNANADFMCFGLAAALIALLAVTVGRMTANTSSDVHFVMVSEVEPSAPPMPAESKKDL